jgi:hypothetical protein
LRQIKKSENEAENNINADRSIIKHFNGFGTKGNAPGKNNR